MKKSSVKRIFSLAAAVALFLGGMIMMVPLRAGAAEPVEQTRQVWTAAEAEMAREVDEGVPLKDIFNSSVTSGKGIHEVIAEAIKVGVDPSLVVYTCINEGYTAEIVIKAALKAGAPFDIVLNSATNAGLTKKFVYVGDVVAAAIKTGIDPSLVVHTAIGEGYPAQIVVKTALKAGAPLDVVVKSALDAGADKKTIYVGAADAGKSPSAVERALLTASTVGKTPEKIPEKPIFSPSTFSKVALTPHSLEPPPAIFGMGGVVLTRLPSLSQTPQLFLIGPLKINPFFALSETFSDNIFFTADDRKRDAITTITPGIRVKLPFQSHFAELEYYSVITRYGKKFRSEDINDHHVNAAMDLNFGDRFGMRFSDKLDCDHEPRSSSVSGNSEVFHANAAAVSAAYRFSDRARIHLDYTKSNWRYLTGHFRDREEGELSGAVFYRVLPRASVFIEYGRRNIAYSEDTLELDSSVDTMQAGATWDFSTWSKGTIKAGLARKNFTSSTRTNGTVKVGSADVRHNFTSDMTIVLTARRSMNEPDIPGGNYFITTGGYAEFTHRFIKEWAYVFRGATVHDLYFSRTDRTILGGIGLRYQAKDWLEFAVDHNWQGRHSSIPGNNYTEHSSIIMVNVSL
ncbi:MAG: outer membrane beta-barrel protein [Nitrospirae bacterium]|nr:outer membrane beta-barrel protein [Nitrospirota bacterium]